MSNLDTRWTMPLARRRITYAMLLAVLLTASGCAATTSRRANTSTAEPRPAPRSDVAPAPREDTPGAFLSRLAPVLRNGPAPRLANALDAAPLAFMSAHVDAAALADLPEAAMLDAVLQEHAGVSFTRDLAPLLAGEISIAVLVTHDPEPPYDEVAPALDVRLALALTDPARGAALLERVLTQGPLARMAYGRAPYGIKISGWDYAFVGIEGNYLWFSSNDWPQEHRAALADGNGAEGAAPGRAPALELPDDAAASLFLHTTRLAELYAPSRIQMPAAEPVDLAQPLENHRRQHAELSRAWDMLQQLEARALPGGPPFLGHSDDQGPWLSRIEITKDGRVALHGRPWLGSHGLVGTLAGLSRLGSGEIEERDEVSILDLVLARKRVRWLLWKIEGIEYHHRIDATMRQNRKSFKDCYARVLERVPGIQGAVTAEFKIERTGQVHEATVIGVHPAVAVCLAREIRSLRFPALKQERVVVRYPFIFTPQP